MLGGNFGFSPSRRRQRGQDQEKRPPQLRALVVTFRLGGGPSAWGAIARWVRDVLVDDRVAVSGGQGDVPEPLRLGDVGRDDLLERLVAVVVAEVPLDCVHAPGTLGGRVNDPRPAFDEDPI